MGGKSWRSHCEHDASQQVSPVYCGAATDMQASVRRAQVLVAVRPALLDAGILLRHFCSTECHRLWSRCPFPMLCKLRSMQIRQISLSV